MVGWGGYVILLTSYSTTIVRGFVVSVWSGFSGALARIRRGCFCLDPRVNEKKRGKQSEADHTKRHQIFFALSFLRDIVLEACAFISCHVSTRTVIVLIGVLTKCCPTGPSRSRSLGPVGRALATPAIIRHLQLPPSLYSVITSQSIVDTAQC